MTLGSHIKSTRVHFTASRHGVLLLVARGDSIGFSKQWNLPRGSMDDPQQGGNDPAEREALGRCGAGGARVAVTA